jgi:Electron transfer flavoprotein, beta subunit
MNIAVFIKASLNLNLIKVESSGIINTEETPLTISEYDKNALEEGIRIKEKLGGKVAIFSALTYGPITKRQADYERIIREALAMGADEAHIILDEKLINATTFEASLALAHLTKKVGMFDIYITGEASMDTSSYQFPSRLSSLLNIPVVTFVRKTDIQGKDILLYRDLEEEIQIIKAKLPVIISVTGEINQPRLPTLKQILQSKTKPIFKYNLTDIDIPKINLGREIKILPVSRKNIFIEGKNLEEVSEKLIDYLFKEGVVKL